MRYQTTTGLRAQRQLLATEIRTLLDATPAEAWGPNQQRVYDAKMADLGAIDRQIGQRSASDDAAPTPTWRNATTGEPIVALGRGDAGRVRERMNAAAPEFGLADWVRGVAGLRTTESVRAALTEGTDSQGGYGVPSVLLPEFIEGLVAQSSLLEAGARVLPLEAGPQGKTYRMARVDTVPTAAWRAESGAVAQSDPAFSALDLTPRSLSFYFKASRELLSDAPNIDEILQRTIAQAFAKEIDRAGLRGTGTPPEIRGLLNISGIGSVTNGAAGTALATIKWSNLATAYQTILEANAPTPTAAIMAPRTLVGFASLADSTGQALQRPQLLDAMQFIATSQIPVNLTVGGSTDCSEMYVGDFAAFVIGLREDVSIVRADQLHVGTGEVGFYCFARVDVGALHPAAFCKVTGIRP